MSVSPPMHAFFRGKPSGISGQFASELRATGCGRTSVFSPADRLPVVWKKLQVPPCAPLSFGTLCAQQNPPRLDAKAFLKPAGHLFLPITREKLMEGISL
jgi:hypothetical protein